jgi:uncharacterized membrane protein
MMMYQLNGTLNNIGLPILISRVNSALPAGSSPIDTTIPTQITTAISAAYTAENSRTVTITQKKAATTAVWSLLANLYNSFLAKEVVSGAATNTGGVCTVANTFLNAHNAIVTATTAMKTSVNMAWAINNASLSRI